MFASQMEKIILKDPAMRAKYKGIYAKDTLPMLRHHGGYIANTDESTDIGEHWVLVYLTQQSLFFIDSFAEEPRYYGKEFEEWIESSSELVKIRRLTQPLQHPHSHFCGLYVLYFFYYLSRHYPLDGILKSFSNNSLNNDRKVLSFAKKKFDNFKIIPLWGSGGSSSSSTGGGRVYIEHLKKDFSIYLSTHNKYGMENVMPSKCFGGWKLRYRKINIC